MNTKYHSLKSIKTLVSKKLILSVLLLLSLHSNAQVTTANLNACGHAVSSLILEYNNMGAIPFHELQVILHMNITQVEKSNLIINNPLFSTLSNNRTNIISILNTNNYSVIMNDSTLHNNIINIVSNDLGYGDVAGAPNYDPCKRDKQGQADCILGLHLCVCAAAAACVESTFGWPACFLGGSTICAGIAGACGNSNDAANPGCVLASKITWSPYLINYSQGAY